MLRAHGVEQIADVRTMPRSRHNPQYAREALGQSLHQAGLGYRPLPMLGGLRHARADSANTGWRNLSFRGFADYMQTEAFADGLAELEELAQTRSTAILCAEAVPWRCHRSLIGDALEAHGWRVWDILSARPATPHRTTPFLRIEKGRLWYPAPDSPSPRTE